MGLNDIQMSLHRHRWRILIVCLSSTTIDWLLMQVIFIVPVKRVREGTMKWALNVGGGGGSGCMWLTLLTLPQIGHRCCIHWPIMTNFGQVRMTTGCAHTCHRTLTSICPLTSMWGSMQNSMGTLSSTCWTLVVVQQHTCTSILFSQFEDKTCEYIVSLLWSLEEV